MCACDKVDIALSVRGGGDVSSEGATRQQYRRSGWIETAQRTVGISVPGVIVLIGVDGAQREVFVTVSNPRLTVEVCSHLACGRDRLPQAHAKVPRSGPVRTCLHCMLQYSRFAAGQMFRSGKSTLPAATTTVPLPRRAYVIEIRPDRPTNQPTNPWMPTKNRGAIRLLLHEVTVLKAQFRKK